MNIVECFDLNVDLYIGFKNIYFCKMIFCFVMYNVFFIKNNLGFLKNLIVFLMFLNFEL